MSSKKPTPPPAAPATAAPQSDGTTSTTTDAAQPNSDSQGDGEPDQGDGEPDYRALYEEAKAQVAQFTSELEFVIIQRDNHKADFESVKRAYEEGKERYAALKDIADEYQRQLTAATVQLHAAATPATEPTTETPADADPHAGTRALLKRMGLKRAYLLNGEVCFDENHARHMAGEDFDKLEVIPADE